MWLELLFDAVVTWAMEYAPKPVRVGCIALFLLLGGALLTIAVWG